MRAKTFRTRKNFPVGNADAPTGFFCLWRKSLQLEVLVELGGLDGPKDF